MPFSINIFHPKSNKQTKALGDRGNRPSGSTFAQFPNEVNARILDFLDVVDLLSMCLVNRNFYYLTIDALGKRLQQTDPCHLRFYFDQESRWRFSIDMMLNKVTATQFTFLPISNSMTGSFRTYNSKILRRPTLYKVALVVPQRKPSVDTVDNFLVRSVAMDIKETGRHQKMLDKDNNAQLAYMIVNTPDFQPKIRPGERWLLPVGFECTPWWLCQKKSGLTRLFESLNTRALARKSSIEGPGRFLGNATESEHSHFMHTPTLIH